MRSNGPKDPGGRETEVANGRQNSPGYPPEPGVQGSHLPDGVHGTLSGALQSPFAMVHKTSGKGRWVLGYRRTHRLVDGLHDLLEHELDRRPADGLRGRGSGRSLCSGNRHASFGVQMGCCRGRGRERGWRGTEVAEVVLV